jgi:tol-pal system protein YbgF
VALAFVLVLAPSASAAANKEHLQLMADIRMLQEQSQQLQQILGTLTDAMKQMTAKLEEQAGTTRKAFADQKLLVDNAASDLRVVREKLDETNVRITSLSQEVEALRLAIPRTPAVSTSPDQALAPDGSAPPETPGSSAAATPAQPPNPGVSPQRLYDTAWADYAAGQWSLAIEGFRTFLRSFPRSEMADDAQFLIGDSFQLDGKFNEAVDAYDQVIKNYPTGDKVPDAYYKRGVALDRLGQSDRAKQSYEFAAKNYPDTDAGRLAKQRLANPAGKP